MSTLHPESEVVFQAALIPKQRPAPATIPDNMVQIATYPPLGQVSQISGSDVVFRTILYVPGTLASEPWQIALWHSSGVEWTETAFTPSEQVIPLVNSPDINDLVQLSFKTGPIRVTSSTDFTVKFRQSSNHEWRWIRDEQGLDDGLITISGNPVQEGDAEDLPDLIRGLNPDLKWRSRMSQCPNTRLWSIEAAVKGAGDEAKDSPSASSTIELGLPWGNFIRWFALVRLWHPWLVPRHGRLDFNLDKDAIMCSFLSPEGKHLAILGVSLGNVVTVLRSNESGRVVLHLRNDSPEATTGTVLVAIGDTFESANAAVMYHARGLVDANVVATPTAEVNLNNLQNDAKTQWYEDWYDGLGYCTWNSLGQNLSQDKVLHALDTLAENGIKIASLIIDDGWQDIDNRGTTQWQHGWNDFEAKAKNFPKGLKGLVSEIRGKHRNIQYIAVWHALLGYWGGLAPDGPLAKRYNTTDVIREDIDPLNLPIDSTMTVVAKDDIARFYRDFYNFLTDSDIDGVKTDGQYMLDTFISAKPRRDLIHAYLREWSLASLRSFSNKVISCMSQSPQMLFSSQLPGNKPATVVRNSDDFFPGVPASQPWHVWANAYNSLLTLHLNIIPDWDMFQTAHPDAGFHAAARCVSGGPIYITDVPGQHDIALIKQITGITPRGKTVVFKPSVVGRAIEPYNKYEDLSLLKVGAYHGRAATGTPILGIFNASSQKLTEMIPLSRFSGVLPGTEYIVRSHVSGKITNAMEPTAPESLVGVSLESRGYDVLAAFSLSTFEAEAGRRVSVGNFGLVGKMTGCAAILNTKFQVLGNGRLFVDTTLKALGVLGLYISALDELSVVDDFMVTIQGQPLPPHTVSVDAVDGRIVRVDIEAAWNELGLESGWANEVEVKLYFPLSKR